MTAIDVDARLPDRPPDAGDGARSIGLSCRLLIEDRQGRVLLARYRSPRWTLPGGPVLAGESMALAATRRLHEQLGLLVLPHCIVAVWDEARDPAGQGHVTVTCAASILGGTALADPSKGLCEAAWFPRHDLPEPLSADAGEALASTGAINFRLI